MCEYTFYDLASGKLLQWGSGPELPPIPQGAGHLAALPPDPLKEYRVENDVFVEVPAAEPDYVQMRMWEYPSITDQLDALWHAMDDGTLPRAPGFYDVIAEIKNKHKKPRKG